MLGSAYASNRRCKSISPQGVGGDHGKRLDYAFRYGLAGAAWWVRSKRTGEGEFDLNTDRPDNATPPVVNPRVLAYCHDGVGIGHLRRTLNICQHIGATHPEASFLVVTGSPYTSFFTHSTGVGKTLGGQTARIDVLKLPAVAKVDNETYRAKYLALPDDQVLEFRESLLLHTTQQFRPDVILVDKAPVGVRGELISTLRWVREHRPGTRIIFGMRDIEDDPVTTMRQWSTSGADEMFEECYDEIWVYGMPGVYDVTQQYQLSARTCEKIKYMGYVARAFCDHDVPASNGVPHVLVTVGGGTDGAGVLDVYLAEAARRMAANGVQSLIVPGPDLPDEDARRLRQIAQRIPNTEWIEFAPCMMCLIRRANFVVCMGGYNTLCEVALNRTPALVVPRTTPRREQWIRAQLWEERGIVEVVNPKDLAPETLARRVTDMRERGVVTTAPDLDLDGLTRVLERFDSFWNAKSSHASTVCM